jgi:POT family proton-dependent oligopeptide transporter
MPAQVSDAGPLLTLAFIPWFNYLVYPAISRVLPLTPLRKTSIGFFLTAASFVGG